MNYSLATRRGIELIQVFIDLASRYQAVNVGIGSRMVGPRSGNELISCISDYPPLRYKRSSLDRRRQYDTTAARILEKAPLVSEIYSIEIRHFANFVARYLINYDR